MSENKVRGARAGMGVTGHNGGYVECRLHLREMRLRLRWWAIPPAPRPMVALFSCTPVPGQSGRHHAPAVPVLSRR